VPRELTRVLLARTAPNLPPALADGLVLQTEPPARRLQLRRSLPDAPTDLVALLAAQPAPEQPPAYLAQGDALAGFLLPRAAAASNADDRPAPAVLVQIFGSGPPAEWWMRLGWPSPAELQKDWTAAYAARRAATRMPLMFLNESASPPAKGD